MTKFINTELKPDSESDSDLDSDFKKSRIKN